MVRKPTNTNNNEEEDILKGCPEEVVCAFFKLMEKVFCKFCFPLRWNALYKKGDFSEILVNAARDGDFITNESYSHTLDGDGPSGDTVLYHLHKLDMETVDKLYKRARWYLYLLARKHRIYKRKDVQLAIDFTDKQYWGELDGEWVRKTKKDGKIMRVHRWLLVSFVDRDQKYVIHAEPVPVSAETPTLLASVLRKVFESFDIFNARVYVDREFFSVNCINVLRDFSASHRMLWLLPAVKTDRVKEKIDLKIEKVYNNYPMWNKKREKAEFRLVIARNEKGELHAFATNLVVITPRSLYPPYSRRWQIETNNRSTKHPFLINTTSKYMPTRDYLMRFAVLCCFAWMLINALLLREFGFHCWLPGRTFTKLLCKQLLHKNVLSPEKVKKVFRKAPASARALESVSFLSPIS